MSLGFTQEEKTIEWTENYKLTWKDFKGKVPRGNRAAAITASGISYQFSTIRGQKEIEIDYKVSAFFYPEKSWYQPNLGDSLILSHEQLHFDITELYARKMRKKMATSTFTSNVKNEVKVIYRNILSELEVFQDQYDLETNFSRNIEQQKIWSHKIKTALDECCS